MFHEALTYFRDEPFIPANPLLTNEAMRKRETHMMDETNWRGDHSVPSAGEHYRYMWKWDSEKAAVINARRGNPDKARTELLTLERFRDPKTGFLSNKIFATAEEKTFRDYPEAWTFNHPEIGSSYSQPPIQAWAALETYQSFVAQGRETEGLTFLQEIYGTADEGNYTGLQGECAYFTNHRQNSEHNPLVFTVHPNETGRDYDSALGPKTIFLPGNGTISEALNTGIRWTKTQLFNHQLGRKGRDPEGERIDWIPEQVRTTYSVNDIMFNVLYANDIHSLASIGNILAKQTEDAQKRQQYEQESPHYQALAEKIDWTIIDQTWNQRLGFFYNLDRSGKQIIVDSITGLFPLLLDTIRPEQTTALLEKLEDTSWFNTPYPIPTHARRSQFYDPHYKRRQGPDWEGPVWIDMNHFIVENGLVKQAERFLDPQSPAYNPPLGRRCMQNARRIVEQTTTLLSINRDVWELYDPETGQGRRVKHFMWSNLGLHFENYQKAQREYDF
jgi:hypothetical protein